MRRRNEIVTMVEAKLYSDAMMPHLQDGVQLGAAGGSAVPDVQLTIRARGSQ